MKFIKRKSAVKPITGSIVDSTNIADKTSNTYSAKIIDEKNKITMINATDLFTPASGYTFKDGNVFKDRNRYFGNFTIQKTNGTFASAESQLGSWNKNIQGYYNLGCFLCTSQWNISAVGRAYISKGDGFKVYDDSNSNKYSVVKIAFDFAVTD